MIAYREDKVLPLELVLQVANKRAEKLLNVHIEGNLFDQDVTYDQQTDQWKKAS